MRTCSHLNTPRTAGKRVVLAAVAMMVCASARLDAIADPPERLPEDIFAKVLEAGFNLRADTWNGNLPTGETKPIHHQLFKGNDYHFYVSTDVRGAKMSLHIYDQDGNLAEDRAWQKLANGVFFTGAQIKAKSTGSYFLILKVDESPEKKTAWEMAYAYR